MNNNKSMSARGGSAFGGKKILTTIALTILGTIILTAPTLAATLASLSPANVSVTSGKSFNITIAVNPQGVSNYTEKIELTYPADILEVKSFNFGGSWMPLSQTGYDLIDNVGGKLIKTAGYPGGLSSSANFGTVSFYAKKTGSAIIKLGANSLALDANNQNVLNGSPEVSVAVSAPVGAPSTEPAIAPAIAQQPAQQTSLVAALGSIITLGTNNALIGIIIGLIILAIIVYGAYWFGKRKNSGQI